MSKVLERLTRREPVDLISDYTKSYAAKVRFSMLGPVASGKSTIAAGIVLTCETISSLVPNFYCRVLPTSTHIVSDANNLRLGRFPEKTDPYTPRPPEAGLLLCERGWKNKKAQVPVCDVAGEITDYIQAKVSGFTPSEIIRKRLQTINQEVITTVRDSQGFITALAADEALMFREKPSILDPDAYTYNVMNEVLEYRRRNKKDDPHIIVVLTKWDKVMERAKSVDMDVYDDSQMGFAKFLANGFPATNMLFKPLIDKGQVKFFRSWFNIQKREDGSEVYWEGTESPRIRILENKELDAIIKYAPDYSQQDYVNMVHHIGSFAQ